MKTDYLKNLLIPINLLIAYIILSTIIFSDKNWITLTLSFDDYITYSENLAIAWFLPMGLSIFVSSLIFSIAYNLKIITLNSRLMGYILLVAFAIIVENYLAIFITEQTLASESLLAPIILMIIKPAIAFIHSLLIINIIGFIFNLYAKRNQLLEIPVKSNRFILIGYTTLSFSPYFTFFCSIPYQSDLISILIPTAICYALYFLYSYSWSARQLTYYNNTEHYAIKIIKATTLFGVISLLTIILSSIGFTFLVNHGTQPSEPVFMALCVVACIIATMIFFILSKKSSFIAYKIFHWIIYLSPLITLLCIAASKRSLTIDLELIQTAGTLFSAAVFALSMMLLVSFFINKLALRLSFK